MTTPPTHPGPWWLWMTAWSLQGVVLLIIEELGIDNGPIRFTVSGVLAALPLLGLYLFLRGRGRRSES